MVLCAANFLPRDEDVFTALEKALGVSDESRRQSGDHSEGNGCSSTNPTVEESGTNSEQQQIQQQQLQQQHLQQQLQQQQAQGQQQAQTQRGSIGGPENLTTSTVGLKPSRANYCISNEKEVEQLMVLLAALTVVENPKLREVLTYAKKHHKYHLHLFSPKSTPAFFSRTLITATGHRGVPGRHQLVANTFDIQNIREHPELQRLVVTFLGSSLMSERHATAHAGAKHHNQLSPTYRQQQQQQQHGYHHPTAGIVEPTVMRSPRGHAKHVHPSSSSILAFSSIDGVCNKERATTIIQSRRASAPGVLQPTDLIGNSVKSADSRLLIEVDDECSEDTSSNNSNETTTSSPPTDEEIECELKDLSSALSSLSSSSSSYMSWSPSYIPVRRRQLKRVPTDVGELVALSAMSRSQNVLDGSPAYPLLPRTHSDISEVFASSETNTET